VATYLFQEQALSAGGASFADALIAAYAGHSRPRCLCLPEGVPMYVARLGSRCILKRMPCTGYLHAPHCTSYDMPPGMSGLDLRVGTAIAENPVTGITSLKLGFALSKREARPGERSVDGKVRDKGCYDTGLTLRGLLHYLWDQAGLTQWQPGFAGRRSWSTVRKRILLASEGMVARGHILRDCLYIPEVFTASRRNEIAERRAVHWMRLSQTRRIDHPLWLLLGELKDLRAARCGFRAAIKHVPDLPFAMSHKLYECVRRFADELLLWGAASDMHLVMLGTFALDETRRPTIEELSLMPTTAQWIPVEDMLDLQLVERLLASGRRFRKGLRNNDSPRGSLPAVALLDTEGPTDHDIPAEQMHAHRVGASPTGDTRPEAKG
jgi:hypothetical protein